MTRRAVPMLGMARVHGRSMLPTLRDGDRLLVVYGRTPVPGRLVVVRLPSGIVAVKRVLRRVPEGWWVERDNQREGVETGVRRRGNGDRRRAGRAR